MENTTANKRIFFAQYYGQKVLCKKSEEGNHFKLIAVGFTDFLLKDTPSPFLSLKSTASISDEDVVALTKIIYKEDYVFDYDILHVSWERLTKNLVLQNPDLLNVECYQYLQSKGYALPFRNLSVKELEFYGWIELEQ